MSPAVSTFRAGEGSDAAARVDYDGLSLGGGEADPNVHVVGAVALVEGGELLEFGEASGGRRGLAAVAVVVDDDFVVGGIFAKVPCDEVMVRHEGEGQRFGGAVARGGREDDCVCGDRSVDGDDDGLWGGEGGS